MFVNLNVITSSFLVKTYSFMTAFVSSIHLFQPSLSVDFFQPNILLFSFQIILHTIPLTVLGFTSVSLWLIIEDNFCYSICIHSIHMVNPFILINVKCNICNII